jgi:DNA end-binding protein Ku
MTMTPRAIWHGHLRLALVSCPVALFNARHDRAGIRFHLINPKTGNRVKMITQDSVTGKALNRSDLVKGYETSKDKYVILTNEDFQSIKVESSSVMTIDKFVDAGDIDPIYYESCYYLAPDGKAGEDVYAVLQEAIIRTGKVALSRVVISQRERTIALRPVAGGLMAHTLYEQQDINSAEDMFDDVSSIKIEPEMINLATQLIRRQSRKYNPADLEDHYETKLRELIDAKTAGGNLVERQDEQPSPSNVIDLVAALKKSLAESVESSPAAKERKKPKTKPDTTMAPVPSSPKRTHRRRA